MSVSADPSTGSDVIMAEWRRLLPKIEASLERSGCGYSAADVLQRCLTGECQFWPMARSFYVTAIVDLPLRRECSMWLGGGDLAELVGAYPVIEAWARAQGCTRIEALGRQGWAKIVGKLGFRQVCISMAKDL